MNSPHLSSEELFHRLLDKSSALLAAPEGTGIAIPDDELHREIIVPLLPALLGDKAIRGHWDGQAATGFPARIARHFENGDPALRWMPADFEIHVTASYSAGPDARALADTLLSEESLRDMTATLMNQLLDALWPTLAPAPAATEPTTAEITISLPSREISAPTGAHDEAEIPEPVVPAPDVSETGSSSAAASDKAGQLPSRAFISALCRKLNATAPHPGIVAHSAQTGASAAVIARRIISRSTRGRSRDVRPSTRGFPSRRARPGCR